MAIPFLNNINLSDNQLLNAKLQVDTTAPTAAAGQIYFNSTDNVARYHNGTAWVDIPRKISVGGTALAYSQAIDLVAGTNVGIAEASGVITISSTDQFQGTVTSVSSSTTGDALDVTVTNATTTPDLAFTWAGAASQYINGAGDLTTFPTIPTVPSNIVETIITTNGTFINLTPATATDGNVTITADLSAGGTPSATTYLRGDNSWEPISAIPGTYEFTLSDNANPAISGVVAESDTVTIAANSDLTSNLTGQASASKLLTVGLKVDGGVGVSDNYVVNQATAVAAADDTIPFNNFTDNANPALITNIVNKTTFGTIPVTALTEVKTYIDNAVLGGLIYQGGYDATLNTPDLTTSPNSILKGWTYTVTVEGTFFGEQLRVGDVLIAEVNDPSALGDWTTVQNNVDLASLTQVGIGNVNIDGAGDKDGLALAYASGTATVGLDINGLPIFSVNPISGADLAALEIPLYNGDTSNANERIDVQNLLSAASKAISYAATITDSVSGTTFDHGLGDDVIVQLYDTTTKETVYADVERNGNYLNITFASTPTNSIRVLVQKIG